MLGPISPIIMTRGSHRPLGGEPLPPTEQRGPVAVLNAPAPHSQNPECAGDCAHFLPVGPTARASARAGFLNLERQ